VAGRLARVLEIALEATQAQSQAKSRQISGQKKLRHQRQQHAPQRAQQERFQGQTPRPAPAPWRIRMVRQMAVAPKGLWKAKQKGQIRREERVQFPRPEEWPMDEVMRDR